VSIRILSYIENPVGYCAGLLHPDSNEYECDERDQHTIDPRLGMIVMATDKQVRADCTEDEGDENAEIAPDKHQ
jgi:hypothetical protein